MIMWQQVLIVLPLALSVLTIQIPVYGRDDENTTNVKSPQVYDHTTKKGNAKELTGNKAIFYKQNEPDLDRTENKYDRYVKPIRVSRNNLNKENAKEFSDNRTIFYRQNDSDISYLIPTTIEEPENVLHYVDMNQQHEPATYLLPPLHDLKVDYDSSAVVFQSHQSELDPLAGLPLPIQPYDVPSPVKLLPPSPPKVFSFGIIESPRNIKTYNQKRFIASMPSSELEPPSSNVQKNYKNINSLKDFELSPMKTKSRKPFYTKNDSKNYEGKFIKNEKMKKYNIQLQQAEPTLALHLTPPKPGVDIVATNLYPKKVESGFQPIPIPVAEFAEELTDVPRAKPVDTFQKNYDSVSSQQEQNQRLENGIVQEPQSPDFSKYNAASYNDNDSSEPETSESNYRHPGRNVYPAPLRQAPPSATRVPHDANAPPPGERTEFRMHGMKGPHSYQFGYDTGKGKNRQFRYEERDNDGRVKGHYGYMDRDGKLRVVNYDADPEHGFRAEAPRETE